jgi:hypothetical protein
MISTNAICGHCGETKELKTEPSFCDSQICDKNNNRTDIKYGGKAKFGDSIFYSGIVSAVLVIVAIVITRSFDLYSYTNNRLYEYGAMLWIAIIPFMHVYTLFQSSKKVYFVRNDIIKFGGNIKRKKNWFTGEEN